MIIVQLTGGLGNQLFQYAFAKSLSMESDVEMKIDTSFYEDYSWHCFSLNPFNISSQKASFEDIQAVRSTGFKYLDAIITKVFKINKNQLSEINLRYDAKNLTPIRNAYIIGYWQSEKYFKKYKLKILEEFSIRFRPSIANQMLIDRLQKEEISVSIHIRRGNFVNIDSVNKIHGTLDMDYYYRSIEYFKERFVNPKFYIFSDDLEWVKLNFCLDEPMYYVSINDEKTDFEDLRLMASCKHNIIANSTFSWWGAYLNLNPEKVIIAPKKWFANEKMNLDTVDLIPTEWIRV
jgi:hypothetical protein